MSLRSDTRTLAGTYTTLPENTPEWGRLRTKGVFSFSHSSLNQVPTPQNIPIPHIAFPCIIVSHFSKWRESRVNEGFHLIDTYPERLMVPASVSDEVLLRVSYFRSRGQSLPSSLLPPYFQ